MRLPPPAENDGQLAEAKASATPQAEEAAESASESESSPPDAPSHNSHSEPPDDDDDDDNAFSSDGATCDCDGMPMQYRRAMRQLETYITGPLDEKREGGTGRVRRTGR